MKRVLMHVLINNLIQSGIYKSPFGINNFIGLN